MFYQILHRDNLWRTVYGMNLGDHSAVKNPGHRWGALIKSWQDVPPITFYRELIGDKGPTECAYELLAKSVPVKDRERLLALARQVDSNLR